MNKIFCQFLIFNKIKYYFLYFFKINCQKYNLKKISYYKIGYNHGM